MKRILSIALVLAVFVSSVLPVSAASAIQLCAGSAGGQLNLSTKGSILSPESAVDIYMAYSDVWLLDPDYFLMQGYGYCLLDLDLDGVLELICSTNDGSGRYSYNYFYRIDLDELCVEEFEPQMDQKFGGIDYYAQASYMKLLKNKKSGAAFYLCGNYGRVSTEEGVESYSKSYMKGGKLYEEYIYSEYWWPDYENNTDEIVREYTFADEEVTKEEYDRKVSAFYAENKDLQLEWECIYGPDFDASSWDAKKATLLNAYRKFSYSGFSYNNVATYNDKPDPASLNRTEYRHSSFGFSSVEAYVPKLLLRENGTFQLTENLAEGMGAYQGTYQVLGKRLLLFVTQVDFNGFLGDDVRMICFEIVKRDSISLLTDLCLSSKDDLFVSVEDGSVSGKRDGEIVVCSDYNNQEIRKGSNITFAVGVLTDGVLTDDLSGITFQVGDTSILEVVSMKNEGNYKYVVFKGLAVGQTTVTFNDSNTQCSVAIPVKVYENNYLCYTLNSVPTQKIEKYPTNVYNANGLYVDSYKYTVNKDQTATVSFDVYNTNYAYGVVEVYDENGNMKDAVLIEKMIMSNASIKQAVWDNLGYLIRDIWQGDLLSYRQESGFSKKTSVTARIPANGYIKISIDPSASFVVGMVNSVDELMALASLSGDIAKFDFSDSGFSKKLTKKLLTDKVYIELLKDGSDASEKLWKNVAKETFISSESLGTFAETIAKNLDELKLGKLIADTAKDFGWSIGENVFTYFSGPIGVVMNTLFAAGKAENIILQQNDLMKTTGVGSIYIQNQGGGLRACQQIKVESEANIPQDVSLNVFNVTLESDYLDMLKSIDSNAYEMFTKGIVHTYNISLQRDNAEIQPDGKVTVYIPIPEDLKWLAYAEPVSGDVTGRIAVYRTEKDGSVTKMDTKIKDGCLVFTTDHFSLYSVVGYEGDASAADTEKNDAGIIPYLPAIAAAICLLFAGVIVGVLLFNKRGKKRSKD